MFEVCLTADTWFTLFVSLTVIYLIHRDNAVYMAREMVTLSLEPEVAKAFKEREDNKSKTVNDWLRERYNMGGSNE